MDQPDRNATSAASRPAHQTGGGATDETGDDRAVRITDRLLAELARHLEEVDPIDWSTVDIEPDAAYALMSSQIAEMFQGFEARSVTRDEQLLIAITSIVKLTVENFVLHHRVARAERRLRVVERGRRNET